jgi:streptogramin lyase
MILIFFLTIYSSVVGVPLTRSIHVSSPVLYGSSPSSTSPYVTTFLISQNSSDFTPFVLYPASYKTVWVVTIKAGNVVGNQFVPPKAQIVNFTIGSGGEPIVTRVITLVNAIPSDIVYDHTLARVWFLENNSLAYYNSTAPRSMTIEHTFPGGSPQYMTIDNHEIIWITLLGANRVAEYDPIEKEVVSTFPAPATSASLQGITAATDGTIWFAETAARRIGHITCQPTSCNVTDYGPPPSIELTFPIQLAVDRGGLVWFTDHGNGHQFGSFNPSTGEWRVFGIGYCSESYNPDCAVGLPNAISLDSNGMIWFSEHFAGRVAKYDPTTGSLTEYFVPATTIPYIWWMWPGPENLVWFTAFGLGAIGYVNANLPVPFSIKAGVDTVNVQQGTSQSITANVTNDTPGPVYLNVSANGHDAPFGSPPLLDGHASPAGIGPTTNTVTAMFKVSAAFTADLGQRYVTLTAYNNRIAVNAFVSVNVTPIPFILRTSVPYFTVGFAFSAGLGSLGIFLIRPPKNHRKDQVGEEVVAETTQVQSQ